MQKELKNLPMSEARCALTGMPELLEKRHEIYNPEKNSSDSGLSTLMNRC